MANSKKSPAARNTSQSRHRATIRQLRERIKQLEFERESYLLAVKALLPKKRFRFTRKELREMEENPYTLEQFIREMEAELNASK